MSSFDKSPLPNRQEVVFGRAKIVSFGEARDAIVNSRDIGRWLRMPFRGETEVKAYFPDPDQIFGRLGNNQAKIGISEAVINGERVGGILLPETKLSLQNPNQEHLWYRAERPEAVLDILKYGMFQLPERSMQFPTAKEVYGWIDGRIMMVWRYKNSELTQSEASSATGLSWQWEMGQRLPGNQALESDLLKWGEVFGFLTRVPADRIDIRETVKLNDELVKKKVLDSQVWNKLKQSFLKSDRG